MKAFGKRLALALATGMILLYFSELAFWARPIAGTLPPEILPTYLVYSFSAYAFLTILAAFRARNPSGLFLAGALFGWLTEGVIVQTMYDDFPLGLSFTGLAWHASISVMLGWYAIPKAVQQDRPWPAARLATLIGLGYGLWAIWWWTEAPPPTPLPAFGAYVFGSTAILILAYAACGKLEMRPFSPSRLEQAVIALLVFAYYVIVTVPAQPLSLLVLPPLVFLTLFALRRNAQAEAAGDGMAAWRSGRRAPPANLVTLLVIPMTAFAAYGAALAFDARLPTGWLVYGVTTPLGFILWIRSLIRLLRVRRTPQSASDPRA